MGFDESLSASVLEMFNYDVERAVEYLVDDGGDDEDTENVDNMSTTALAGVEPMPAAEESTLMLDVSQYTAGNYNSACTAISCAVANHLLKRAATTGDFADQAALTEALFLGCQYYNDVRLTDAHSSVWDLQHILPSEFKVINAT